jgi:TolA-binding protein
VQRIGAVLVLTRPTFHPSSFLVFLLAFVLSSCGIWDSMTAYFNTFYNSQRLFDDAEEELWNQKEVQQFGRNYYLATFATPNKTKFTQVIEKCSRLLQYHPESRLVADALFLIGMSSFYQGDYQQADRKFRELLDRYPDGSLTARSAIMLAYTQYRLMNRDSAAVIAGRLYDAAVQEGENATIGQTAMLLGQIEKDRENRAKAREFYVKAGETAENAELRTTAYLNAAQLAEEISDFPGAESSYRSAAKASRVYVGEYRGFLGVARMRALQGDFSGALERLNDLRGNLNYREFFGEIAFEIGNVRRLSGNLPQAIIEYGYVDTAFARTESAAKAAYELGLLYETRLQNLDSARAAYTRGRNHSASAIVAPALARKAEVLGSYIRYRNDLRRADSIRVAWVLKRDSMATRRDSLEKAALSMKPEKPDSALMAAAKALVPPNIDSLDQQIAGTRMELATLFYTGMERSDSAAFWYRKFLRESPKHPGVPRALYTLAQIAGQDSSGPAGEADSLYHDLVRRFPATDFADEARKALRLPLTSRSKGEVEAEYEVAADLIKAGKYAEAVTTLRKITASYPGSALAPRAQYAIGWLYENEIVTPDSAIANYQVLVSKFPASPFVTLVQPKLMAVQTARAAAKVDSTKIPARQDTVATKIPAPRDTVATKRQVLEETGPGSGRRARQAQPQKPPAERE